MISSRINVIKIYKLHCRPIHDLHKYVSRPKPNLRKINTSKLLQNQVKLSTNLCSTVNLGNEKNALPSFTEIYRFPAIRYGYYLHKLKWLQTLISGAAIPISSGLYLTGIIEFNFFVGAIGASILTALNIYGYAQFFHQAVGFMYLSEDGSVLKISYLDFWGNRVNEEIPVNDIEPFGDARWDIATIFYRIIVFYSERKVKPKLYVKKKFITDRDKFTRVFGSLEIE